MLSIPSTLARLKIVLFNNDSFVLISTRSKVNPPPKDYFKSLPTTESGQDFLERALVIDPRKRASSDELLDHDFLTVSYCPNTLSELAFDVPPTFESDEKRAADEDVGVKNVRHEKKAKIADSKEEAEMGQESATKDMENELAEFRTAKLAFIQELKAVKKKGLALDARKGDLMSKYGPELNLGVQSSGGTEY